MSTQKTTKDPDEDEHRRRDVQERPRRAETGEALEDQRLPAGDHLAQPAQDGQHAERRDQRVHADDRDEEAVDSADAQAARQDEHHAEAGRDAVTGDHVGHHHAGERGARPDREVELSGDEQERRRRRDDAGDGDGGEDIQPVVPAVRRERVPEVRRLQREKHDLDDEERDERRELGDRASLARPHYGRHGRAFRGGLAGRELGRFVRLGHRQPPAASVSASVVISSPAKRATIRPRAITATRSATCTTSS